MAVFDTGIKQDHSHFKGKVVVKTCASYTGVPLCHPFASSLALRSRALHHSLLHSCPLSNPENMIFGGALRIITNLRPKNTDSLKQNGNTVSDREAGDPGHRGAGLRVRHEQSTLGLGSCHAVSGRR